MNPFIEEITQAALDRLSQNLSAELTSITSKYAVADAAAGRTVPLIVPVMHFGKPDGLGFERPSLFVYAGEHQLASFGIADPTQGSGEYVTRLFIEVYLISGSTELVERQFTRFAEAINNILYKNQSLGGPAVSVAPRRFDRMKETGTYERILRIEVSVESYPTY